MMLSWLPKPLIGALNILLYGLNLLFCSVLIYIAALLKLVFRGQKGRQTFEKIGHNIAKLWASINDIFIILTSKTTWEIDNTNMLSEQQWYLLLSNHQSWADIIILEKVFIHKIPMLKFFLKEQLRWVPLVGTSCWALNFPFMQRYSKEFLEKNPHLRGKDLETTQKTCAIYQSTPTTLINFVEGTRLTKEKQAAQQSPFKHLLKPKAGGTAFTLGAMNGMLKELINVTIIYHGDKVSAWDFFCGTIPKITIKFDITPITDDLIGDYQNNEQFRAHFQTWLNNLWSQKDELITRELQKNDN
ncbi:MAG: acyltransferase [Gammaproteobacteria bacterium]